MEREVEDLAALIDHAGGSAFVYGFSGGALLALHAAAAGLPIPRLAVLEPPIREDGGAGTSEFTADLAESGSPAGGTRARAHQAPRLHLGRRGRPGAGREPLRQRSAARSC